MLTFAKQHWMSLDLQVSKCQTQCWCHQLQSWTNVITTLSEGNATESNLMPIYLSNSFWDKTTIMGTSVCERHECICTGCTSRQATTVSVLTEISLRAPNVWGKLLLRLGGWTSTVVSTSTVVPHIRWRRNQIYDFIWPQAFGLCHVLWCLTWPRPYSDPNCVVVLWECPSFSFNLQFTAWTVCLQETRQWAETETEPLTCCQQCDSHDLDYWDPVSCEDSAGFGFGRCKCKLTAKYWDLCVCVCVQELKIKVDD